jgi:hypothetical protein
MDPISEIYLIKGRKGRKGIGCEGYSTSDEWGKMV